MAKAKTKKNPGFDVVAASDALRAAAIAEGATVPKGAPNPLFVAVQHAGLHGVSNEHRCTKRPCRLAGACFALWEVLDYRELTERAPEIVAAADACERLRATLVPHLRKNGPPVYKPADVALTALVEASNARDAARKRGDRTVSAIPHDVLDHWTREVAIAYWALTEALKGYDAAMRSLVTTRELQQPSGAKRSGLLLRAICQHLHWGGFTWKEIAELVPDADGENESEFAVDRARHRYRLEDARSKYPWNPETKAKEILPGHHSSS
jgi:hypothetical protein